MANALQDTNLRTAAEAAFRGPLTRAYNMGEDPDSGTLHQDAPAANRILEHKLDTLDACFTYCHERGLPSWMTQELLNMAIRKPCSSVLVKYMDNFGTVFRTAIGLTITGLPPTNPGQTRRDARRRNRKVISRTNHQLGTQRHR